jgi:hypothetical protein
MTVKPLSEEHAKLLKDHFTLKEAFLVEELQGHMIQNVDGTYSWSQEVKLRLQEKKDWEEKLKELFAELYRKAGCCDDSGFNETDTAFLKDFVRWNDVKELFEPLVRK